MAAFSKNPLFDFDNLPDSFSNGEFHEARSLGMTDTRETSASRSLSTQTKRSQMMETTLQAVTVMGIPTVKMEHSGCATSCSNSLDPINEIQPSPTPTPRPRIKGAESSFRDVKPDLKPQYGETIITPRQLGKTAVRKGVQEDLDSDDEIIWNMKHSGYKDEPIAARLVHEGRTHYDPKTIATRWGRMVRVQRKKEQKILDEDFSDYHEEEVRETAFFYLSFISTWTCT